MFHQQTSHLNLINPTKNSKSNKENHPITSSAFPSGALSVTKIGEELNLRPLSPHRYNSRVPSKYSNCEKLRKHFRSSTECSTFSKFIPATELVSAQDTSKEPLSEKDSECEISGLSFDDEPGNSAAFPTQNSNRNSMIVSGIEAATSAGSSPFDQRLNSIQTFESKKLERMSFHLKGGNIEFQKLLNFKASFVANEEKVYCPECDKNVFYFVKVRKTSNGL
jgi:hypothetical protein